MNKPKTVEEFNKLSYNIQGALWPRCKSCGHIAQEHNDKECGFYTRGGKCPTCGIHSDHVEIKCFCLGYNGPQNVEELVEYLNKD